jgi:polyisoprenoid-binding protein YceI
MPLVPLRPLAFALVAAAAVAAGRPRPYALDPARSRIEFLARSRFDDAEGTFHAFRAELSFDPDTVTRSSVVITIDPASLDTRIGRRDHHLKSCDFFCVDSFPEAVFRSTAVTAVGPDRYRIDGTLTLRGITRPLTVPAQLVAQDAGTAEFDGAFDLDRRDFGLGYSSVVNPIRDTVRVSFHFALRDTSTATP